VRGYNGAMSAAPRPVAILFADVCGSTSLYEKLGDTRALAAIESVLNEVRLSLSLNQGRVVKTIGDEIMAVLPTADAAMQAAVDMQNRVTAMPPRDQIQLAIRVGFHFGPAIEEAADYFGDAVNVAARMAGKAKAGRVITNGDTVAAMSPLLRQATRELDPTTVKGKMEEMQIVEVMWADSEESTTLAPRDATRHLQELTLVVKHGAITLKLDAAMPRASMGRDAGNDIVTADRMASRVHARIEFSRGKFFLKDESTNGTYLTLEGDEEIVLKREQTMLRGRGRFCFGHSARDDGAEVASFAIE
jgi:adenylate cyclase